MAAARRPRVLVIDDDPHVRESLGYLLTALGYAAQAAADGAEGLALFDQGGYDLVVTDLLMPGLTGWDVAEAVRRRAPVVLITGSATMWAVDHARAQGLPLVAKPFSVDELSAAVAQALRAPRDAREQSGPATELG